MLCKKELEHALLYSSANVVFLPPVALALTPTLVSSLAAVDTRMGAAEKSWAGGRPLKSLWILFNCDTELDRLVSMFSPGLAAPAATSASAALTLMVFIVVLSMMLSFSLMKPSRNCRTSSVETCWGSCVVWMTTGVLSVVTELLPALLEPFIIVYCAVLSCALRPDEMSSVLRTYLILYQLE